MMHVTLVFWQAEAGGLWIQSQCRPHKEILSQKTQEWTGEMAYRLRAVAALLEDLGLIPSTVVAHNPS